MSARRLHLVLALVVAVMALVAITRKGGSPPASSAEASPRATDPMRPKVWDFPGHNKW